MQSAWEKMTQGRCNNSLVIKPTAAPTARQIKAQLNAAKAKAKFTKIQVLRDLGDVDAKRTIRKMADTWTRRGGRNVEGFHKPVQPGFCTVATSA